MSLSYRSLFTALALLLFCAAPPAGAESTKPYYLLIGMGPQWRESASDSAGSTSYETGFSLNGAAGFRLPWGLRAEFEGAYFYNEVDTLRVAGRDELPADGSVDATALFGNLYYDIPLRDTRFTPYLGAGAGSYKVSVNGLTNDDLRSIPIAIYAESGWTFAWQLRAGTTIALNQNLDLLIGYRYFHGNDMDLVNPMGTQLHPSLRLHNLELGARYNF